MESYLNYLKKEYEKTDATTHLKMSGWNELTREMGFPPPKRNLWAQRFSFAFAVFAILMIGTYRIALGALPGDPLYKVKILSEKIVQAASGNNQIVIDHRAQEIVGLSQKQEVNKAALEEVSIEYKESVNQATVSGKPSINFQTNLFKQHSEFDKIGTDHPDIRDEIRAAQDASDQKDSRTDD